MNKRMKIGRVGIVCGLVLLAVGWAMAEVSAVSDEGVLDTRRISSVTVPEVQSMDIRTYTVDWSESGSLNTREIVGTVIRLR